MPQNATGTIAHDNRPPPAAMIPLPPPRPGTGLSIKEMMGSIAEHQRTFGQYQTIPTRHLQNVFSNEIRTMRPHLKMFKASSPAQQEAERLAKREPAKTCMQLFTCFDEDAGIANRMRTEIGSFERLARLSMDHQKTGVSQTHVENYFASIRGSFKEMVQKRLQGKHTFTHCIRLLACGINLSARFGQVWKQVLQLEKTGCGFYLKVVDGLRTATDHGLLLQLRKYHQTPVPNMYRDALIIKPVLDTLLENLRETFTQRHAAPCNLARLPVVDVVYLMEAAFFFQENPKYNHVRLLGANLTLGSMNDLANMVLLFKESPHFQIVGCIDQFVYPTVVGWRSLELDVLVVDRSRALPRQVVKISLMHQVLLSHAYSSGFNEYRLFDRCESAENVLTKLTSSDFFTLFRIFIGHKGGKWSVCKNSATATAKQPWNPGRKWILEDSNSMPTWHGIECNTLGDPTTQRKMQVVVGLRLDKEWLETDFKIFLQTLKQESQA